MKLDDIQKICRSLDNVTEDIKWGQDLCFNIGGKMFLVTAPDSIPVSASFKTDEETFNELAEREGFKPAPYLARHKWIYVDDVNRLSKKEGEKFIRQSYELIKAKLPKKKK
jgi:predicted DNA-binding protein (MmcQ/YjbR family)